MKKDKDINNLIEKIENEHDQESMASIFETEGEKDVADFIRATAEMKKDIEPDRSLLLKILNDISSREASIGQEPVPTITKVGLQLRMGTILKFAVPTAVVVMAAIIIWSNPFNGATNQVAVIKDISKEAKTVDQANTTLQSYLNQQKSPAASNVFASSGVAVNPTVANVPTTTPFDTVAITNEANSVAFDSGLANFIAQEKSMSAVDATLASF